MNAMAQGAQRMTADEYLAAPYDGRRTMLVEGEVILNQPALPHQTVLMKLIFALGDWGAGAGRSRHHDAAPRREDRRLQRLRP